MPHSVKSSAREKSVAAMKVIAEERQGMLVLLGLAAMAALTIMRYEVSSPLLYRTLRGEADALFIPSSLDAGVQRRLSLDLGDGNCKWQPPAYDVPEDIDFHKTLIAGFPSGDKRMTFIQMEALSGWPAKDEWDFEYLGMSNHPFIKANYPHHEGIWGWDDAADQVVMVVRNIRRAMTEYHDILWDIGYAETWHEVALLLDELYGERPPIEDFFVWRDLRVMEEIHWYGWFIDYWMEGGLMRDMFTHKITTPEHWNMLMIPGGYSVEELDYDLVVGADTVVTPSYDPHCTNGDVSGGCEPVAVVSAENLKDYTKGPAETTLIANALINGERMGKYVINEQAWDCIWEELIVHGRGVRTVYDRPGYVENDYNFSAEMLEEMIHEQNRLIAKYDGPEWNTKATANKIVDLLVEHRALIQTELNEVNTGVRRLTENDFLGPKSRMRRRKLKAQENNEAKPSDASSGRKLMVEEPSQEQQDYSNYYFDTLGKLMGKKRLQDKRRKGRAKKRREARQSERRASRNRNSME